MSIETVCEKYKETKNHKILSVLAGKMRSLGYSFDETAEILGHYGIRLDELDKALYYADMENISR